MRSLYLSKFNFMVATTQFKSFPIWLRFFFITILAIGIFFRFAHLGQKVYWYDEVFTSLRVSGYTEGDAVDYLSNHNLISSQELYRFQQTNSVKNPLDTIKGLAKEEPQHSPLYYFITRLWVQLFGNSVGVTRSVSAVVSLLSFILIYYLCLELFNSPLIGWMAVSLIAVSPFHVLYAQESRPYSLWITAILLSCLTFLQAIRRKTKFSWFIYGLALATSFYTFFFSALVAISYGIYVIVIEKFRLTKTVLNYVIASGFGLLLFSPWIFVVFNHHSQAQITLAWSSRKMPFLALLQTFIGNFSKVFIDWDSIEYTSFVSRLFLKLIALVIFILVIYSLFSLSQSHHKKAGLFLLVLIGITMPVLILHDLISGGRIATVLRYFIPAILGIEIAIAYFLTNQITNYSLTVKQQKLWQIITVIIISSGIISCAISFPAKIWWNKEANIDTPTVASIINQANHPLVISDSEIGDVISLNYLLKPEVQLLLHPSCYACQNNAQINIDSLISALPKNFNNIFLFKARPEGKWLNKLKQEDRYPKKLVFSRNYGSYLWKLK